VALIKIRNFLKDSGQSNMLDSGMTLRFIFTFGLFLLALLISTAVTDFNYITFHHNYRKVLFGSYIFVYTLSITSQVMLACILLKLTKEEEVVEE
jgi:hypothetical protein